MLRHKFIIKKVYIMKKKHYLWLISLTLTSITLLSGCVSELNRNSVIERSFQPQKLKNGKTYMLGYIKPKPEWGCKKLGEISKVWSGQELVGALDVASGGTGASHWRQAATDYINQHPEKKINYVFEYIPNQHKVLGITYDAYKKAHNTFYHCQKVPKEVGFWKAL